MRSGSISVLTRKITNGNDDDDVHKRINEQGKKTREGNPQGLILHSRKYR